MTESQSAQTDFTIEAPKQLVLTPAYAGVSRVDVVEERHNPEKTMIHNLRVSGWTNQDWADAIAPVPYTVAHLGQADGYPLIFKHRL